jgi:hypothetical protein
MYNSLGLLLGFSSVFATLALGIKGKKPLEQDDVIVDQ